MSKTENEDATKSFEVTVRRGHNDRVEVLSITAKGKEAAEEKAKEKSGVRKVLSDCTVEFRQGDNGKRRYGTTEE